MKKLSEIKLTKNQKYFMYFGGAVLGTIIIVKIIKGIIDGSKGGESVVKGVDSGGTQTVYTDKYLSTLPLGVDNLTWASKVPAKYLPKYDAIALAKSDATYKAKVMKVQQYLQSLINYLYNGYPVLVVDGKIGPETTKAMILIANHYKDGTKQLKDLLPLATPNDLDKWIEYGNLNNKKDDGTIVYPWWNLK